MSVFIDTSFFYARTSPRDQWYRLAKQAPLPPPGAVTTSLVVSETVSLMQVRGYFSSALEFLREMRAQREIEIVYPKAELQGAGWDLLTRYGSGGANAVDCTSFAVMNARRIKLAYTFDDHFREAGFRTLAPPG